MINLNSPTICTLQCF